MVMMSRSQQDRGWAWVVLLASFVLQMFVDGLCSSYGVFYTEFHEMYPNMDRAVLALPGSLMCGLFLFVGPLASLIINTFGFRAAAVSGCCLVFTALLAVTFSWRNFSVFIVCFGVMGGVGLGLVYLPALMAANYYFVKKRAVASGVGMAGAGVGYILFPKFSAHLVQEYGLQGALLVLAGISLHMLPAALVLLPIQVEVKVELAEEPVNEWSAATPLCGGSMPTVLGAGVTDDTCQYQPITKSLSNVQLQVYLEPLSQKDIFYSSHLGDLSRSTTLPPPPPPPRRSLWSKMAASLPLLVDVQLLRNKHFLVILLGGVFLQMGYFVPLVYLVDYSVDTIHLTLETAATLMVIFGVAHTCGRLCGGVLLNLGWSSVWVHNVSAGLVGVVNLCVPLCRSYPLLCLYSVLHSFFVGVYVPCCPIVLVNMLGIEKLTQSYGFSCCVRGAASFIGPVVAGFILDATGQNELIFIFGGAVFTIATIIYLPLFCWKAKLDSPQL